jgi:hypothetical protein
MKKKYLTTNEVAKRLNKDDSTLFNWREKNIGPAFLQVNKVIRYPIESVEKWEQENTKEMCSEAIHTDIDIEQCYTRNDICEIVSVSETTVRRWKKKDGLPFIIKNGIELYPKEAFQNWLREYMKRNEAKHQYQPNNHGVHKEAETTQEDVSKQFISIMNDLIAINSESLKLLMEISKSMDGFAHMINNLQNNVSELAGQVQNIEFDTTALVSEWGLSKTTLHPQNTNFQPNPKGGKTKP